MTRLFDQDGLPWTSRIRWGVLLFWIAALLLCCAPLIGIYLGLWLRSKRMPLLPLALYVALTLVEVTTILATSQSTVVSPTADTVFTLSLLLLWLSDALVLRHEVIRYYAKREGTPVMLNPLLTALFGPWYVGGHLRADFPLDHNGKTGRGVLKLVP